MGHLGDDCPISRKSSARLYTPSAFSNGMQSRGPFFDAQNTKNEARPTHMKWDDEEPLPFTNRPFGGAEAGKKSRDKAKKEMMARARAGIKEEDEVEGWFDSTNGNGNMPFGHSHLMSKRAPNGRHAPARQNKKITFGKLSMPNGAGGKKHQPLPPSRSPKKGKVQNDQAVHAVGTANSSNNGKKSKVSKPRRRQDDAEVDWEMEWQNSGINSGGGKVEGWGKELDREEKAKKKATQTSQARGEMKAKATGQKYLGGY